LSERLFDWEDPIGEQEDNIGEPVNDKTAKRKKGKEKERATSSKGDCKGYAIDANTSKAHAQQPKPRRMTKISELAERIGDSQSETVDLSNSSSSGDTSNKTSVATAQGIPIDDFNGNQSPPATPVSSPALTPLLAAHPRRQVAQPPSLLLPPHTPSPNFSIFSDSSEGKGSQEAGRKCKPTSLSHDDWAHRKEVFSSVAGSSHAPQAPVGMGFDDKDVPMNIGGVVGMISRSVNINTGSVKGLPALGKNQGYRC
jgi:hypothetical protein